MLPARQRSMSVRSRTILPEAPVPPSSRSSMENRMPKSSSKIACPDRGMTLRMLSREAEMDFMYSS